MTLKEISQEANRLKHTLLQRGINEDWINNYLTEVMELYNRVPSYVEIAQLSEKSVKYIKESALMERVIGMQNYQLGAHEILSRLDKSNVNECV